jgi:general secretion pathway protein L
MPYKLLIRLNNKAEMPIQWALARINGKAEPTLEANPAQKDLYAAAKLAQSITVLVPAEDVLLTQVKLPKLSPSKLMKAIPYALEDQLTEEASLLHFSIGTVEKGKPITVAVVSRDKMQQWQNLLATELKEAKNKVKVFLPDVLATPWENDTFTIVIEDNMAYVRTDKLSGFAIEKETLFTSLLLRQKRTQPKPNKLIVYRSSPNLFSAEQTTQLTTPIVYSPSKLATWSMLVIALREPYAFNLLQGAYASKQKKATLEQLVKTAFILAGVSLLLLTLADVFTYCILTHENSLIDHQLQQIYASVYPGKKIPDDPKNQMQKELTKLRASNTDSAFTRLLNIVGPGISPVIQSGATIKTMRYRNNQLVLDIEANDLTAIESLRLSLETQGFKATLSNAERGGSGLIDTRLTVEEIS